MSMSYTFRVLLAISVLLPTATTATNAHAAETLVTAEFKPNASDPSKRTFTNTTPLGFYCQYQPQHCTGANAYMFDVPITLTKEYEKGGDIRRRWFMRFPGFREVYLRNANGHATLAVISFNAVSGEFQPGGSSAPVYTASVSGGCTYIRTTNAGAWLRFGWGIRTPLSPTPCYSQGDGGEAGFQGTFNLAKLGIGLIITTATPLSLQNGIYEGQTTFSLGGQEADIDFGDGVTMNDPTLTLRFQFTVAHDLKVTTAAGADTARLQPLGGWARWAEHGIAPKALQSDLPFTITGSAPFSLRLDCEFPEGEQCAIRSNLDGQLAPVDIAISMPGIRSESTGSDANRYRLRANTGRETFMPTAPIAQRPSRVHFNVEGEPMQRMLAQPGSHWQGRATLIFDTEID